MVGVRCLIALNKRYLYDIATQELWAEWQHRPGATTDLIGIRPMHTLNAHDRTMHTLLQVELDV